MSEKPPKGFVPFDSKKGGYRKRSGSGFEYWYPDGKGTRGKSEEGDGAKSKTAEAFKVAEGLESLYEDVQKIRSEAQKHVQRHKLERERQRMQAVVEILTELAPGIPDEEFDKIRTGVVETYSKSFHSLVGEILIKARATKYCRKEPTGNPKRPWDYKYGDECGGSAARMLKEGTMIRVGKSLVKVEKIKPDGTVILTSTEDDEMIFGRKPPEFKANEWSDMLRKHYGASYQKSAKRRARQAVNAVLRHVPPSMLAELKGDTEQERLKDLKKRAPEVYKQLEKAIKRTGIDLVTARMYLSDTLAAEGWQPEARAALLGNLMDANNAWLASNYRRAIRATNNARTGDEVTAAQVQAAIDIIRPGGPGENVDKMTEAVAPKVEEIREALDALRGNPDLDKARAILAKLVGDSQIGQLMAVTQALPETVNDTSEEIRKASMEIQAAVPRPPSRDGAETTVYVAGKDGAPVALRGRYKLMEAEDAIPSHNADNFSPRQDYPDGLQERQYHRDKNEQMKVMRNAQRMEPGFVINTNPDALNGPPIMNGNNHVLGGNSRTMSIQRIYKMHPEKADEYRSYLRENAYQAGFSDADLEGLENPILVRVVDTDDQDDNLLVRQMNESFIQAMDPRTMQVAMGRRLTNQNLSELAETMNPDETLRAYLDTNRAKGFIETLGTAGIIDNRNRSQYVRKNGKLNEDGKQLVERILVGHLIPDPDILSNTPARLVGSIARVVPYMVQAEGSSQGYNIRENLRDAMDGFIRMNDLGFQPPPGATDAQRAESVKLTRSQMTDLFTGDHPVVADERTGLLFNTLVQHGGPRKLAKIFKEYARLAQGRKAENMGQASMLGGGPQPPEALLQEAIDSLGKREEREALAAQRLEEGIRRRSESSGQTMFRAARDRLDMMKARDAKKTPAEPHERKKGSSKNKKGSAATGSGSIKLSESTIETLKNKVKEHNEKSSKKVTLGQLKAVYRRGAGAFSTSHHPNANRHSWSMGRVNSFLRRVKGGKGHSQDDDLIKSKQMYKVPESARNNARKVLEWKKKHGSEVKGMTPVGWARARQLASQTHVSVETVRRMAAFNRHRKNAEVAPEHKSTPWKDAGRVAWLGWGGSSGVDWARGITGADDES